MEGVEVNTPQVTPAAPTTAAPSTASGGLADNLSDKLKDPLSSAGVSRGGAPRLAASSPPPSGGGGGALSAAWNVQFDNGGGSLPADSVQSTARQGVSGTGGALPHLGRIQAAFGKHDVSGVQAHTGASAQAATSAMGAKGFATGNNVAFSSSSPSLHTAAHEAAHVVQQASGVRLKGGVGAAGDSYERHADAVADAVVSGKSAEGLLSGFTGAGSSTASSAGPAGAAVQGDAGDLQAPAPKDANAVQAKENKGENDVKLLSGEVMEVKMTVPIAATGFSVNVEAKVSVTGEETLNDETMHSQEANKAKKKTHLDLSLKIGGEFNLVIFKIGLRLFGKVKADLPGELSKGDAIQTAVKELGRYFASDKVNAVAEKLAKVDKSVAKYSPRIDGAFAKLEANVAEAAKKGNAKGAWDDVKEEAGTENSWINPARTVLEEVRKSSEALKGDLVSATGFNAAGDAEAAANYLLKVPEVTARVKSIADEAGKPTPDGAKIAQLATKARADSMADINGAIDEARNSINAGDFKKPTAGVAVQGAVGGEVYAGFAFGGGGGGGGEISLGGGAKVNTAKTKKEVINGKEEEVFDKQTSGVVVAAASFQVAGFAISVDGEFSAGGGKRELKLAFDAKTPELPIGLQPGDIKTVLGLVRQYLNEDTPAAQDDVKNAGQKEDGWKGKLKAAVERVKGFYNKAEPALNLLKRMGELGAGIGPDKDSKSVQELGPVTAKVKKDEIQRGMSSILLGGKLKVTSDGASGSVYLGLGQVKEIGIDAGFMGAKVKQLKSEKLELPLG